MIGALLAFDGTQKCANEGHPDDWFPEEQTAAQARELCDGCPFIQECADWAIPRLLKGVWGGTTEAQRKKIRHKKRIRGIHLDAERLHQESVEQHKARRKERRAQEKKGWHDHLQEDAAL